MEQKEHLTLSGLHKIIALKAAMNFGHLSEQLKAAFPHIVECKRPSLGTEILNININPYWVVGFTDGEGCFSISITKSSSVKIGFKSSQLRFRITQHSVDLLLMQSLIKFWGCGKVFERHTENKVDLHIIKFEDLVNNVIPLFQKIPLQGEKSKDFLYFCKAVELVKVKQHLTTEGLKELRLIKEAMNKGRN